MLVLITTAKFDNHALRLVHLVDERRCVGDDFAHGAILHHGGDGDDALTVFALDGGRVEALHHGSHFLESHGSAAGVVEQDVLDGLDALALVGVVQDLDVILVAVLTEVTCRGAVDAVAQGVGRRAQVQTVDGQFLAVEVHLVFWLIVRAADVDVGRAWDGLQDALEALRHGVGLLKVVAVDFVVDDRLSAHAAASHAAHVHHVFLEFGVVPEVLAHESGNLHDAAFALRGVHEPDVHRHDVRAIVAHRGIGVVAARLTHGVVEHLDFGILLGPLFVEAFAHVLGEFHAAADGQLEAHAQTAVVAGGEELATDELHQEHGGDEDAQRGDARDVAVVHAAVENPSVDIVEFVEHALHGGIDALEQVALAVLQAQHAATQHGGERQRRRGGDNHHDGHHPSQLAEEHTRHARDQGEREKHRDEGEGRGDHTDGHLVGAMHGGLLGRRTAFDVGGDILQHHDGVVHHHTDGDGQCRQRHDVQRVAGGIEIDERGNERDGDGEGDDDRGAPATQEEQHHDDHEEQRIEHGLDERGNGVANVVARVHDVVEFHVGRQVLLDAGQHIVNLVADLHRVGSALLLHDNHGALHAVVVGLLCALLERVVDACHIAQVHHAAVACSHHDVFHLHGVLELALHAQGIGFATDVEGAARDVTVLGANERGDALHGEAIGLEADGVYIDVHLPLGSAGNRHRAHAIDTGKWVGDVLVENLIEARHALASLGREQHDGNHVGTELEDDGRLRLVGQIVGYHVEFVAHIVGERIDVVAILKFKRDDRDVLLAVAGDVLEVLHAVEGVLERSRDVLLDILRAGALIGGHHHDGVGVDVGVEVDGQFLQREQANDDHRDKDENHRYRALDRTGIDTHEPV